MLMGEVRFSGLLSLPQGPQYHTVAVTVLKETLQSYGPVPESMVHLCLQQRHKSYWALAVNLNSEVKLSPKRGRADCYRKIAQIKTRKYIHTHTKAATALYMTHILGMTLNRKEIVGIAAGLFHLIRLLAGTNSIMTKPPWSWVYQGFSESYPQKRAAWQCSVKCYFLISPHTANVESQGRSYFLPLNVNFYCSVRGHWWYC